MRLAILGTGNVRCSLHVFASLANHFGDRPVEVRLWDPDEEMIILFRGVAESLFGPMKNPHDISIFETADEVVEFADAILLQLDERGMKKLGRPVASLLEKRREEAAILSLMDPELAAGLPEHVHLDWPVAPKDSERVPDALYALRIYYGEEDVYDLLGQNRQSPLRTWLETLG